MQKDIHPDYLASQGLSANFPQRFWKKVFITPTHWLWDAYRKPCGHGQIWRGWKREKRSRLIGAHVASYILNIGPIPEGMCVLHCCPGKHVPFCVNPEHLYLGTPMENTHDIIEQGNMYFYKGHPHVLKGELNPMSKLTRDQVDDIRNRYTGKSGEQNELASAFGVTQAAIRLILTGQTWGLGPAKGLLARAARIEKEKNRVRHHFPMIGESNPTAVLTQQQAHEIRSKYQGKRGQQSALAREYGCSQATIWNVVNHLVYVKK